MIDLTSRSNDPELMDGEDVSQAEYTACMQDLAVVNIVTLARRPTLRFIDGAFRATPNHQTLTIMDVGFGAGDMLRAIDRLAAKRGRSVRLVGVDLNPRSEQAARQGTPDQSAIEYRTGDYATWPLDDQIDMVVSSLVTHHMSEGEILAFLKWMEERARLGWLVNDLHRHRVPYYGFLALACAMRWHSFVRHDGPLSIARAFKRNEWQVLLESAGIGNDAEIAWWTPFRLCVERKKW